MTTDLYVLLGVGLLAFVLQLLPGFGSMQSGGIAWGLGNRDVTPEMPAWAQRAKRAHANLMENLPHFTALVLVAAVSGEADATTASACWIFLGARIVHAIVYVAGITVVRTLAFYAGVAAELAIAYAICTA